MKNTVEYKASAKMCRGRTHQNWDQFIVALYFNYTKSLLGLSFKLVRVISLRYFLPVFAPRIGLNHGSDSVPVNRLTEMLNYYLTKLCN